MENKDYLVLKMQMFAHRVVLCGLCSTHKDKAELIAKISSVADHMQSLLLNSRLDDQELKAFEDEIQLIFRRSHLAEA